ncbi:MAG: DUF134 domain-containing protein [bacterium]
MVRPRMCRRINVAPRKYFFKPQGVPLSKLKVVELNLEEIEALRLKNIEGLDQIACAEKMNTSQSTFQRILSQAYKKIAQALIKGQAIKIIKQD